MHSRLNGGRQLLTESQINGAVPERHTYTHEICPRILLKSTLAKAALKIATRLVFICQG